MEVFLTSMMMDWLNFIQIKIGKNQKNLKKTKHNKTHDEYKYSDKEQAILIWNELEKLM